MDSAPTFDELIRQHLSGSTDSNGDQLSRRLAVLGPRIERLDEELRQQASA